MKNSYPSRGSRLAPILHDFRRTITSTTVIIAMALLIVLSLTIISLNASSQSSVNTSSNTAILDYIDSHGYNFLIFSTNGYGQPLSGISSQFNITDNNGDAYSGSGSTNSTGFSLVTISAPIRNDYSVSFNLGSPQGGSQAIFSAPLQASQFGPTKNLTINEMNVFYGSPINAVQDPANSSNFLLQVFYAGPNGTIPDNYGVYYKFINSTSFSFGGNSTWPFTRDEMMPLGTLSQYYRTFSPVVHPGANPQGQFWFGVFLGNGTALYEQQMSVFQFSPSFQGVPQSVSIANAFFSTIMAFFVPLIVIMGAYSSYGKDRISGVLESIISKPVTRRGLGLSRFTSTVLGLCAATLVSIIVVDVALGYFDKSYLSGIYLAATFGGFIVEIAAFTAIIFLISHLVKTTGELIGIGVGIYVILVFLWSLLAFALTRALNATPGSLVALKVQVAMYFVNPAQFVPLVYAYLTQSLSSVPIPTSAYGLTPATLIAAGLIWALAPLFVFLRIVSRRD